MNLEPIEINLTVNRAEVIEEFSKIIKASKEQAKSIEDAQKSFANFVNTQLSASEALSENAVLTEKQIKALNRHAETLEYLKSQIDSAFDPTQISLYEYQIKQAEIAIQNILDAANNKAALFDEAEITAAQTKLKEAGRILDQISDKNFNASFASPEELEVLSGQINTAKDEMESLGVVVDFVTAKMGLMDENSDVFKELEKDIATANAILGRTPSIYDATGNSLDQLNDALKTFQEQLKSETDPEKIKVLNQNIQEVEKNIKAIKNAGKDGFDEFGNKIVETKEKSVQLQTELENTVQSMAKLRMENKAGSQEYQVLKEKAVQLRSAIAATNQEINASASATSGLDGLIRATSAIASGYAMVQGAAALFGNENKNVEQSIMKITAVMSVLQSLQQIQTELKRKDSVATMAQSKAQALYTTIVGGSTGALKLFRIALAATGIGLVIILLASLVANWDKVTASIKKSFPALNGFGSKIDELKAYLMGFLRAYLSLYQTVWNSLMKLKNADFKGALSEISNIGDNAKKSFNTGKTEQEQANATKKLNAELEKQNKELEKQREILDARGDKRGANKVQEQIFANNQKIYKNDKEKYEENEHQKKLFYAKIQKEQADEAKRIADKRQQEAEAAAKKAEQLAQQFKEKQLRVLASIKDAEQDYHKSRLSDNEKAFADIKDKYAKMRKEAQDARLSAMDIMQIDNLEKAETSSTRYKQGTDKLLKDLDVQKEAYAAYEAFKTKVGKDEADKRFETAKLEFQNFGEMLQAEIDKLNALQNLTPEQTERKTKLEDKKKDYDKDKGAEERERYAEAYTSLMSYDDKRRAIEQKYQQDRLQLQQIADAGIREAKMQELEFQKQQALDALNTEAYDRATLYERMSENLIGITRRELKNRIATLEEYLEKSKGTLTDEQKAFVEKELQKARAVQSTMDVGVEEKALLQQKEEILKRIAEMQKKGITNVTEELQQLEGVNAQLKDIMSKKFAKVSEVAGQLGGSFTELGGALKDYDEGLGDTVETMGELLNVAGEVAGAAASFASGDIVGGITKTIKAITSIFSIGAKARESERKAQEQIKKYHDEIFQSQLNYNAELRKRVADEVKLNDLYKSRVTNIKEEMEANKKNAQNAIKDQQEVFKRLLKAQSVVGMGTEKYGGFWGIGRKTRAKEIKKSVAEILGVGQYVEKTIAKIGKFHIRYKVFEAKDVELTDEIFDKLEKLNGEKPLTGDAKTAYDQLKKLRDEYGSIEEAQRQLQKQLKDAITGTTADSLADSIKQGIASGKKAFSDFADDIEGFLRNAVLAGLETDIFREKTQKLQDRLAEMMEDGTINNAEREEFNRLYMAIVEESRQKMEMLNQAGLNVIKEQESANSLQGAVKGMSQESANILTGHIAGLRLDLKDIVSSIKNFGTGMMERVSRMIEIQLNIEKNTRRTAENTDKLHDINEGIGKVEKALKNNPTAGTGL